MKVKDCMVRDVVTVKRSTTLAELIDVFRKYNFHTIPVVENDGHLVGIVTFENIMKVFQPYSSDLTGMLKTVPFLDIGETEEDLLLADISSEMGVLVVVDDLMDINLVTVDEETHINQVRSLMKLHDLVRLPVVREDKLVGIVSLFDIILAIFREKGIVK